MLLLRANSNPVVGYPDDLGGDDGASEAAVDGSFDWSRVAYWLARRMRESTEQLADRDNTVVGGVLRQLGNKRTRTEFELPER